MKLQITVYGCLNYFEELQRSLEYDEMVSLVCSKYVDVGRNHGLRFLDPMINREFIVSSQPIPIESLYFSEIVLDGSEAKLGEISEETLKMVIMIWGDLWDQFVRSFIDCGGFVGTRLVCGTKQVRWSAEGRNHTAKTE